jgi:hypothetical protein
VGTSGRRVARGLPDVVFFLALALVLALPALRHVGGTPYAASSGSGSSGSSSSSAGTSSTGSSSNGSSSNGSSSNGSSNSSSGSGSGTSGGSGSGQGGSGHGGSGQGGSDQGGSDQGGGNGSGGGEAEGDGSGSSGTSDINVTSDRSGTPCSGPVDTSGVSRQPPSDAILAARVGQVVVEFACLLIGIFGFLVFCLIGRFSDPSVIPKLPGEFAQEIARACRHVEVDDSQTGVIDPDTELRIEVLEPAPGKKRPRIVVTPQAPEGNTWLGTLVVLWLLSLFLGASALGIIWWRRRGSRA